LVDDSAGELNPVFSDILHQIASKNDETLSKKLVNQTQNNFQEIQDASAIASIAAHVHFFRVISIYSM
jgi:enoyl-[acyl-carrier-protein] reductase (NADH)